MRERLGSLAAWIASERITIYHSVPSILRRALDFGGMLPDVRVVRLEGDRSFGREMTTWRRHFRPGTLIANGLGTTETGLCRQLVVPVEDELADGIMPVGYPVTDMDVCVVDEHGDALPPGEVGEIAVTSRYLAVGYLDDDALTASAFRPCRADPGCAAIGRATSAGSAPTAAWSTWAARMGSPRCWATASSLPRSRRRWRPSPASMRSRSGGRGRRPARAASWPGWWAGRVGPRRCSGRAQRPGCRPTCGRPGMSTSPRCRSRRPARSTARRSWSPLSRCPMARRWTRSSHG